jgi:hypothetical protein
MPLPICIPRLPPPAWLQGPAPLTLPYTLPQIHSTNHPHASIYLLHTRLRERGTYQVPFRDPHEPVQAG